MGVFTGQKITVYSNGLQFKFGTKQPISSGLTVLAENVPCRITGTQTENLKLFMLKKYYSLIAEGIHQGYKIVLLNETTPGPTEYIVINEPIWAGGTYHHIEVDLNEWK